MRHLRDLRGSTALEFKSEGGDEPDPVKAIEALSTALNQKMTAFSDEMKKVNEKVDAEIANAIARHRHQVRR